MKKEDIKDFIKTKKDLEQMDQYVDAIIIGTLNKWGRLDGTNIFLEAAKIVAQRNEILKSFDEPKTK
jgi:hypothetical protein